jgi:hypothetical protein
MDTTVVLIVASAIALAVGGFAFLRLRRPKEQPYYHFHCPGCRRRLRYRARQAGHAGACNRCGQRLTFPPVAQSMD